MAPTPFLSSPQSVDSSRGCGRSDNAVRLLLVVERGHSVLGSSPNLIREQWVYGAPITHFRVASLEVGLAEQAVDAAGSAEKSIYF